MGNPVRLGLEAEREPLRHDRIRKAREQLLFDLWSRDDANGRSLHCQRYSDLGVELDDVGIGAQTESTFWILAYGLRRRGGDPLPLGSTAPGDVRISPR
jgi:hypothetical protein